jgi:uncharacterized membrane protein
MTEPYQPPVEPVGPAPVEPVSSDDKLWSLLAYVFTPIIPVVIMLMEEKKNRPFIKAHNFQALVAGVALIVATMIVGIIPVVGCVSPILALVGWVYLIYLGIQAYNGNYVTIPFITDFVKKQNWG